MEFLVILGGNPVYTAPADLDFVEQLQKVPLRIHHGLFLDETSYQCHWHLPEAHYLEAWSDAQAYDGTTSIVQPLIEPLYEGRSAHEVLALLANLRETPGREIVRTYWRNRWEARHAEGAFEPFWEKALHDGVIPGTAFQPKSVQLKEGWENLLQSAEQRNWPGEGKAWKSSFSRTRRSTTARGPTTAGSRNCPSRSRSSPGATPPS